MCGDCPKGKYNDNPLRVQCIPCSVGKFANETSLSSCFECEPGFSQNLTSAWNCSACLPGFYSEWQTDGINQIKVALPKCTSCVVGKYSKEPGATSCLVCDPGKIAVRLSANGTNSSDAVEVAIAATTCRVSRDCFLFSTSLSVSICRKISSVQYQMFIVGI